MDYIIDILVIFLFVYIARMLWITSNRKTVAQSKLLFRSISLFVIFHLILFPLLYAIVINNNPHSISLNENIITDEKEEKLKRHLKIDEEIQREIEKEVCSDSNNAVNKNFVNKLLNSNKMRFNELSWKDIDDNQLVFLDSNIIRAYTEPIIIPEDPIRKSITFYNLDGKKIVELFTTSKKEKFSDVLVDLVAELNQDLVLLQTERKNNQKQIIEIRANAFWSYRQILPYTLNILFTSNFTPQSKSANIIYFIHNILVAVFLLTFIANIFQYQLIKNNNIS